MSSWAGAVAVAAFWAFLAVASAFGIVYDYRKRKLQVDSLRIAIEHGQSLDPQLLTRLIGESRRAEQRSPEELRPYIQIGGIMTIASGVGVALLSFFVGRVWPVAFYPTLGLGVVGVCVGVGLLFATRALKPVPERVGADRSA